MGEAGALRRGVKAAVHAAVWECVWKADPALAHMQCGVDNYFCHSSPSPSLPVKLPVL